MPSTPEPDVDPETARRLADEGAAVLLDVREPDEWTTGHAPGAVHLPLGDLDPAALRVDGTLIAVCRSGNRSGTAATALAAAGHRVHNMAGGMIAWDRAGLPVVRDDGSPGTVG